MSRVHIFSRRLSPGRGERRDEKRRNEKKILLHDTIVVAPAVPAIQYRTRRVCLSQQRHINIVIVYEQILSILSEKPATVDSHAADRELKISNRPVLFGRWILLDVLVVRTFGLKSDRLQIKTKKITGHKTHVREI